MIVSLRDGETLQDYAFRVTAELEAEREKYDSALAMLSRLCFPREDGVTRIEKGAKTKREQLEEEFGIPYAKAKALRQCYYLQGYEAGRSGGRRELTRELIRQGRWVPPVERTSPQA